MLLSELMAGVDIIDVIGSLEVPVDGIAYHAADVGKNFCFVAIAGNVVDGHAYVDMAVENGAAVVVSAKAVDVKENVTNIVVTSPRQALAIISSNFFKTPSGKFNLVGITGTNGKTTVTYLLESIWIKAAKFPGIVGTVNYRYGSVLTNPKHTTPQSYDLQKLFKEMADTGVTDVAMEVSSHSLDQKRVSGCQFDGAIFTNLTQDHLDYHLDMKRYKEAKALLFNDYLLKSSKKNIWAAINIDDPFGNELAGGLNCRLLAYSLRKEVDVFVQDLSSSVSGLKMKIKLGNETLSVKSPLVGEYNASNILAAVTAASAMNIKTEVIKKGVEGVEKIPGRLEPVQNSRGFHLLVDYAHTPDALKNVTSALKDLKRKKLITVFGCGGDRDKTKRPLMGYEAALNSDVIIVTSDNPRSENPRKIVEEILFGVRRLGLEETEGNEPGYIVIVDRKEAIKKAIHLAGKDDIVLIAGKGHEDYQIIGDEKLAFDDVEVAKSFLK